MLDETDLLQALRRHWEYSGKDEDITHEIYHDDAVMEFPQSGERFEGVENFREWRRHYRAKLSSTPGGSRTVKTWWLSRTSGAGDADGAVSGKYNGGTCASAAGREVSEEVAPSVLPLKPLFPALPPPNADPAPGLLAGQQ